MTWTFNPAPRGHAVTFDFPVITRPAPEPLVPAPSEPEEDVGCGWTSRRTRPAMERAREARPITSEEYAGAPLVATGFQPISERGCPTNGEVLPRASEAMARGGGGGLPGLRAVTPTPSPKSIVACAMSGNLCAIATLELAGSSWRVCRAYTRLFQLTDTSQPGMRGLAGELFQFLGPLREAPMISCPTKTGAVPGGLEDEARLETLLMMLPGLQVQQADNDVIANWVLSTNPADPENMPTGRNTFAQIRAIEAAQYMAEHMN